LPPQHGHPDQDEALPSFIQVDREAGVQLAMTARRSVCIRQ
jgi:hypothetical protein